MILGIGRNYEVLSGVKGQSQKGYPTNNASKFSFNDENYARYLQGEGDPLFAVTHDTDRQPNSGKGENQVFVEENVEFGDSNVSLYFTDHPAEAFGLVYPYSGSVIKSYNRLHFGRIEAFLHLPHSRVLWPSLWLITAPNKGGHEIDIMERFNHHQGNGWRYQTNIHGEYKGHKMMPKVHRMNNEGWFGINWTPYVLEFTYNGQVVHTIYRYRYLTGVPVLDGEVFRYNHVVENLLFPTEPMWLVMGVGIKDDGSKFYGADSMLVEQIKIDGKFV